MTAGELYLGLIEANKEHWADDTREITDRITIDNVQAIMVCMELFCKHDLQLFKDFVERVTDHYNRTIRESENAKLN